MTAGCDHRLLLFLNAQTSAFWIERLQMQKQQAAAAEAGVETAVEALGDAAGDLAADTAGDTAVGQSKEPKTARAKKEATKSRRGGGGGGGAGGSNRAKPSKEAAGAAEAMAEASVVAPLQGDDRSPYA